MRYLWLLKEPGVVVTVIASVALTLVSQSFLHTQFPCGLCACG